MENILAHARRLCPSTDDIESCIYESLAIQQRGEHRQQENDQTPPPLDISQETIDQVSWDGVKVLCRKYNQANPGKSIKDLRRSKADLVRDLKIAHLGLKKMLQMCNKETLEEVVENVIDLCMHAFLMNEVMDDVESSIYESLAKQQRGEHRQQENDRNAFAVVLGACSSSPEAAEMGGRGRGRACTGLLAVSSDVLTLVCPFLAWKKVELRREWKCGFLHENFKFSPCGSLILTCSYREASEICSHPSGCLQAPFHRSQHQHQPWRPFPKMLLQKGVRPSPRLLGIAHQTGSATTPTSLPPTAGMTWHSTRPQPVSLPASWHYTCLLPVDSRAPNAYPAGIRNTNLCLFL